VCNPPSTHLDALDPLPRAAPHDERIADPDRAAQNSARDHGALAFDGKAVVNRQHKGVARLLF
jgi:hypothetical protein